MKASLARLLKLAGTQRLRILAACALSGVAALLALVPYLLIERLIALLIGDPVEDEAIVMIGAAALVALVLKFVCRGLVSVLSHVAAFEILHDLRLRLLEALARQPLAKVVGAGSGRIKKIIMDDVEAMEIFLAHHLEEMSTSLLGPSVVIAALFWIDWRVALATLTAVVAAVLVHSLAFRNHGETVRGYHNAQEEMNRRTVEYVRGIPVIKSFARSPRQLERFTTAIRDYNEFVQAWAARWYLPGAVFSVTLGMPLLFSLPIAASLYQLGDLTLSETVLCLLLSAGFTTPLYRLTYLPDLLARLIEGEKRIEGLLRVEPLPVPDRPVEPRGTDIAFQNVALDYGERRVLDNITFTVPTGAMTVIVGPSGAGKSSLIRLVPRFHDVTAGSVRIGGADVREIDQGRLMGMTAFMFQETFLFNDTVIGNIRLARPDATHDEVIEAAHLAGCDAFVRRLPDGYDTLVGAHGRALSGGERQRISLARTLLKDSPIVLLDEATASVDAESEARIHHALRSMAGRRTLLLVTHKPHLVAAADHVVFLWDGRLRGYGDHGDLMRGDREFRTLFQTAHEVTRWAVEGAPRC